LVQKHYHCLLKGKSIEILYSDRIVGLDSVRVRSFTTDRPFEWTSRHFRSPCKRQC